jgi:hypothetical protein
MGHPSVQLILSGTTGQFCIAVLGAVGMLYWHVPAAQPLP